MLSSGISASKENFHKMKMEEQTVPSAGFSPQPEYMTGGVTDSSSYYSASVPHLQHPQQQHQIHPQPQQNHLSASSAPSSGVCYDYNTSFDTFDLSLLGDSYEDKDMATVPSPSASCWSPLGALEPTIWQTSFYPTSPPEDRAFSPDCKPFRVNMPEQQTAVTPSPQPFDNVTRSDDTAAHHNSTNILLRQCLEDNTFIEKYNFKPVDLPITSLPSSAESSSDSNMESGATGGGVPSGPTDTVGSATLDNMNLEPFFSLAYETIISEIENKCRTLGISPDPMQWSVENVHSWLSHSFTNFSADKSGPVSEDSSVLRSLWNIDGRQLCSLTEQEFRQRDPLHGEKIYANLELLKMWKSTSSSSPPAFDFNQLLGNPQEESSKSGSGSVVVKVELDENMQPISSKFSNPGSVDTSSSSQRNSDDDDEDDDEEDKQPAGGNGGVGGKAKPCGTKNGAHIHLWQFLKELLAAGQQHGSCIRWLDQSRGVFKIEDSVRVARLWGIRKNRPAMNYDKLSRSIRQYYRKGIMRKTERSQRLVYQFCHPYGL